MIRALAIASAFAALVAMTAEPALAQRRGRRGNQTAVLQKKVQELQKQVAELAAAAASVPALTKAVQELETKLAEATRQLQELSRAQQAAPDPASVIDTLRRRVAALEQKIAALRAELTSSGQTGATEPKKPETGGGGRVKYDNGFGWQTGDGRYRLKIIGFMQTRYSLELNEDFDDTLVSTLQLRRGRLGISGHARTKKLRYNALLELARKDQAPLLDYFVDYDLHKYATLRFGQYKSQFTRSFITGSTRLAFSERPLVIDAFRPERDVQVGVHGLVAGDRFGYYAGFGNGAGPNRLNDNIDIALTARADAVVLGRRFDMAFGDVVRSSSPALMVGVGASHDLVAVPDAVGSVALDNTDVDGNGQRDNVRVISASVDAVFRMSGIEAVFEGVLRREAWGTIFEANAALSNAVDGTDVNRTYLGFYGQVTYMLPHKILVGGRASYGKLPFLGLTGQRSTLRIAPEVSQFDALVQLYNKQGLRSIGLTYSLFNFRDPDRPDPAEDKAHRFILEAQLSF